MLYTLRDPLGNYEVGLWADVRRPRLSVHRFDQRWIVSLARSLCGEDANERIIARLVEQSTGRAATGAVLHERFAELVAHGRLVFREVERPDAYPLPDPYADSPMPLAELSPVDPVDDAPRRTWISVELVHAAELSTERVELEVTTASGREVHGRLDATGRWRSDDIDGGSCTVRIIAHPVLRRRSPAPGTRLHPGRGDITWRTGSEPCFDLRSAEHHRIVIVQPPEIYCPTA